MFFLGHVIRFEGIIGAGEAMGTHCGGIRM